MSDFTESQRDVAEAIALDTNVLDQCEDCGLTIEGMEGIDKALIKGYRQYDDGAFRDVFKSRDELRGAICAVVSDYPSEQCACGGKRED